MTTNISTSTEPLPSVEVITGPTPGQILRRNIVGHKGLMIGGGLLLLICLAALAAPLLATHNPYLGELSDRLITPFWNSGGSMTHPLGTDSLGRDYLSRLLYGARISLIIGLGTAAISGIIGLTLGLVAGYFGGRVDMIITYLISVRLSLPTIVVSLAVVQLLGGSLNVVIMVLGFILWDRFAIVTRSATQQIRSQDFVKSAQAVGCSTMRIIFKEIAPNVMNQFIVIATLEAAHAILLEAALSFLGVGVQPPTPSWGLMINQGKTLLFFKPWLVTIPGVALFVLVLSINLLGDGVRDVTAPEQRN
ncbi:MAG: ABC transporter permease [Desulfuromonadales bacterium]|nr:ABC transporter permease [Desulfuromonadales bacterium]